MTDVSAGKFVALTPVCNAGSHGACRAAEWACPCSCHGSVGAISSSVGEGAIGLPQSAAHGTPVGGGFGLPGSAEEATVSDLPGGGISAPPPGSQRRAELQVLAVVDDERILSEVIVLRTVDGDLRAEIAERLVDLAVEVTR